MLTAGETEAYQQEDIRKKPGKGFIYSLGWVLAGGGAGVEAGEPCSGLGTIRKAGREQFCAQ